MTIRSVRLDRLGVPHAFSTRVAGVSPPPWRSLNLGQPGTGPQDDPERVGENIARFVRSAGLADRTRVAMRQVHGATVWQVDALPESAPAGDALWTRRREVALMIRIADCVPLLLVDRLVTRVGAVHAGWRGVVAGVAPAAVWAMASDGAVRPAELCAVIGPCIGLRAFEVGPEVASAFDEAGLGHAIDRTLGPRPHIDLAAAVRHQLLDAGLAADCIDIAGRCTHDEPELFFSHRRARGATGRMAAIIALPGEPSQPALPGAAIVG